MSTLSHPWTFAGTLSSTAALGSSGDDRLGEMLKDPVGNLGSPVRPPEIRSLHAVGEGLFDRGDHALCVVGRADEVEQHRGGPDLADRIGDTLPRDVRGRT